MFGNGITQTPGVVTNVSSNGLVTQTPVLVTNTDQSGGIGYTQGYGQYSLNMAGSGGSYDMRDFSGSGMGYGMGMGVTNVEVIPGPPQPSSRSRVQYVPVQQRVIDYQTRQWIQTVPRQQTITQYQERRWAEQVPREVTRTDHYAVEYLRQYVPEVIATKDIQIIPQQRIVQRTDYIPVQRQINHGLQGTSMKMGGTQVVGIGQAINHQVVSMGFTQGQTIITPGVPMPPQITGIYPGVATGTALSRSGSMIGGFNTSGVGINNFSGVNEINSYGMGINNVNYCMGSSGYMTQTPGVVTNMNQNGIITQTPVLVTNRS